MKHSFYELNCILTKFLNDRISHCYLPRGMMAGVIRPLTKHSFGDLTSSSNYRPIICSSVILQLFEYISFDKIEFNLKTNDRQLSYKEIYSSSTE